MHRIGIWKSELNFQESRLITQLCLSILAGRTKPKAIASNIETTVYFYSMPYGNSEPSPVSNWRCPLCHGGMFQPVVVERPNKPPYKTDFYSCYRCSVVFLEPDKFARLGMPVKRWANDVGPETLQEAFRFWERKVSE